MRWWFAILALAACTKDEAATDSGSTTDTDTPPPPPPPTETSHVRFVNASEAFGTAYLFECPLGFATTPETAEPSATVNPLEGTGFREFDSGSVGFAVAAAGSFVDCDGGLTFDAAADASYTLWVTGTGAAPTFGFAIDDAEAIPLGFVRLDLHHVAVGEDAVALTVGEQTTTIGFGASQRLELAAEAFLLEVDADEDGTTDLAFTIPPLPEQTAVRLFLAHRGEDFVIIGARANGTYVTIDGTPPA